MVVVVASAVEFVRVPQVQINLAQTAIYLVTAPKSNTSYNKGLW